MRIKERIPVFMKNVDWSKFIDKLEIFKYNSDSSKLAYEINRQSKAIEKYWTKNPNLRIVQVLYDLRLIPKGYDRYTDDLTYLVAQGVALRKVTLWTDESGEYRLVDNLSTDRLLQIKQGHGRTWIVTTKVREIIDEILIERGAL